MTLRLPRSRLPHALAGVYALAIVYASLQPFGDWMMPPPGTRFWLLGPWDTRWVRFDILANLIAYAPLGFFVALVPRRAPFARRVAVATLAAGALSFAMETLQWFLPPRDASLVDFVSNTGGALGGALVAAAVARHPPARDALAGARHRLFLDGTMGDIGLALLALWLAAQANPGIAMFAITFDTGELQRLGLHTPDLAGTLLEAATSGFQVVGIGLFVALLARERRLVGGAVLSLIALALVAKGVSGSLLLKPAAWETWLRPGILLGVAGGALLLLAAIFLPRAAQIAVCAIALLSSLLTPMLVPELLFARPPLSMFSWRYGQLLNFNGLTRAALLLWPLAASAWLFALAGRPRWGEPLPLSAQQRPAD